MVIYPRDIRSANRMISFAQTGEDILIDRVFRRNTGFFIDVGACHPVAGSVTKYCSLQGWRGLNIEPDDAMYAELVRDRPQDVNLKCLVGRTRGRTLFHQISGTGLSTVSPAFFANFTPAEREATQSGEVEQRTLADICEEYVSQEIDFLKIDVEGVEGEVIAGANWQRFRPRLLVIEATRPWSSEPNCAEWEPALLAHGYSLAAGDGINRYYVRHEDQALAEQLSVPVNVLDAYMPHDQFLLREQIVALQAERERGPTYRVLS